MVFFFQNNVIIRKAEADGMKMKYSSKQKRKETTQKKMKDKLVRNRNSKID